MPHSAVKYAIVAILHLRKFVVGKLCCIIDVSCEIFSGGREDRRKWVIVMISVRSAIDMRHISLSSSHLLVSRQPLLHAMCNSV